MCRGQGVFGGSVAYVRYGADIRSAFTEHMHCYQPPREFHAGWVREGCTLFTVGIQGEAKVVVSQRDIR